MKTNKLSKGEIIVNSSKDKKVLLTKKYEDVHFFFGDTWKNVEVYTLYRLKKFLGIFEYWSSYSDFDSMKVFQKFRKSLKKQNN